MSLTWRICQALGHVICGVGMHFLTAAHDCRAHWPLYQNPPSVLESPVVVSEDSMHCWSTSGRPC